MIHRETSWTTSKTWNTQNILKHHETLLKHCVTSRNTWTLTILCDDIDAWQGDIGARPRYLCSRGVSDNIRAEPRWKINSFLSEILVCWSCMEKITIKIERAFSVILLASPATRRSFQLSPQLPTVTAANLGFNAQLATANAWWRLASLSIRCLCQTVCWHKRLLS